MNEVATAPKEIKPPLKAGSRPAGLVPTSIEEVARIANIAISSGLQVGTWKDTAEEKLPKAMMIILQGLELNVAPVQALNGIALISGRPCPWGKFARALVLRSGHKVDEWTTGKPYDADYTAHCKVTRGDNGQVTERDFSVQDARDAGLWDERSTVERKNFKLNKTETVPNDAPWFRYKKDMLAARAFSRAAVGVSDSLLGMEIAEVLRDVENHRSDTGEEDKGPVHAAPPPPLADDADYLRELGRKPPENEPEPVEPEKRPAPPTPAEEKVPEYAVDMLTKTAFRKARTVDELEKALADFETEYDGRIDDDTQEAIESAYRERVAKLS
jgi:hypothetical protein